MTELARAVGVKLVLGLRVAATPNRCQARARTRPSHRRAADRSDESLIEQSRHLLPHGGRTTLYAGTKTNTAPSGGDVKKVTSGARCSANVGLWHRADIKLRPLFGRYGVESGHHRLIVSISAFDPTRTSYRCT